MRGAFLHERGRGPPKRDPRPVRRSPFCLCSGCFYPSYPLHEGICLPVFYLLNLNYCFTFNHQVLSNKILQGLLSSPRLDRLSQRNKTKQQNEGAVPGGPDTCSHTFLHTHTHARTEFHTLTEKYQEHGEPHKHTHTLRHTHIQHQQRKRARTDSQEARRLHSQVHLPTRARKSVSNYLACVGSNRKSRAASVFWGRCQDFGHFSFIGKQKPSGLASFSLLPSQLGLTGCGWGCGWGWGWGCGWAAGVNQA